MPLLLLKLPADVHTKLAAFVRANDAARFCFAGKEAYKAFGIQQWRACLYATHGGLRIGAEPNGLNAARRLATCGRGCLGFRALATDGGTFDGGDSRFWVDALFRPEPWRIYCSRQTRDPILCAATFLPEREAEDVDSRDRHWMCELIIETWSLEQLQVEPFSSKDYALGSVFLRVCHGLRDEDVVSLNLQNAQEAITKYRAKILEIVQRFNTTGAPAMRIGLDKTVFAQRGGFGRRARRGARVKRDGRRDDADRAAADPRDVSRAFRDRVWVSKSASRRRPRRPPQAGLCGRYAIHTRARRRTVVAHTI